MLFTTVVLLMNTFVRSLGMIDSRSRGARKSWDETKIKLDGAPMSILIPTEKPGGTGAQPTYSGVVRKTTHAGAQVLPGIHTHPTCGSSTHVP